MYSSSRLEKIYLTQPDGVMLTGEPGEYSLINSNCDLSHRLNDTAAQIWRMCEYQASVAEIVTAFSETYNQPEKAISNDIISVLNYLSKKYLISIWEDNYIRSPVTNNPVVYHKPTDSLHQILESFRASVMGLFLHKGEDITPRVTSDALQVAMREKTVNAQIKGNALFLKSFELEGIEDLIASVITELDKTF